MLIGLVGPICSGKREVAKFLETYHGFRTLHLGHPIGCGVCESTTLVNTDSTENVAAVAAEPFATLQHESKVEDVQKQNQTDLTPVAVQQEPEHIHQQPQTHLVFHDINDLCAYATRHWLTSMVVVVSDTWSTSTGTSKRHHGNINDWIQVLQRRPFFLLVAVDAPVYVRFNRWKTRQQIQPLYEQSTVDLTSFVHHDDIRMHGMVHVKTIIESDTIPFDQQQSLAHVMSMATVRIMNSSSSLTYLHTTLQSLNLSCPIRLRPDWDTYFIALSNLASRRSNCMKRRVGCILVRQHRIIATGYNGTPRGVRNCHEGGCHRCNDAVRQGTHLDLCLCLHAEENALLEAGRDRIRTSSYGSSNDEDMKTILYCTTCPCIGCAKKIVQAGVHEVVYSQSYAADHAVAALFEEAGIVLRRHAGYGHVMMLDKVMDNPMLNTNSWINHLNRFDNDEKKQSHISDDLDMRSVWLIVLLVVLIVLT